MLSRERSSLSGSGLTGGLEVVADYPTRYLTGPLGKQARPKAIEFYQTTLVQKQRILLHDVTLDILEGESVALLGPPLSGKSALLACVQGLMQPARGEVRVLGATPHPLPVEVRRQIGTLPLQLDLARRETVAAYLRRFAAYYDVHLTSKQLTTYCTSYELEPSLQVASLSSRQARIFALSLSLVHDPRLVLLDEPLSGLSAADQTAIWPYLQRIQREGRTLLCTFSLPLAEKYLSEYDLIVRLEQGRLMRQETRRGAACKKS